MPRFHSHLSLLDIPHSLPDALSRFFPLPGLPADDPCSLMVFHSTLSVQRDILFSEIFYHCEVVLVKHFT